LCRSCRAEIPAEEADLDRMQISCHRCGVITLFATEGPRPQVPKPPALSLESTPERLTITRRWVGISALFVVEVLGPAGNAPGGPFRGAPASRQVLVRYGPRRRPWPVSLLFRWADVSLYGDEIENLYCVERIYESRYHQAYSYDLL